MMIVAIISLVLYGLIGLFNVSVIATDTRRVLSWLFAAIFLVVSFIMVWPLEWIMDYLLMLVAICVVISMEIAHFKTTRGDRSRVFLVHVFTAMLAIVYVILLFAI